MGFTAVRRPAVPDQRQARAADDHLKATAVGMTGLSWDHGWWDEPSTAPCRSTRRVHAP